MPYPDLALYPSLVVYPGIPGAVSVPAFTVQLGNWDFSAFLRVNAEDNMDPYGGNTFEEPGFSDAPLSEGQPLINVDAKNREMQWPLFLNASAGKDTLHALVSTAVQACKQAAPLRVAWKDTGSSKFSYYDVTFARFETNFNYRRSAKNWLAGTLHVWCAPPYAHTATERVLGSITAATQLPVVTVPVQSCLGDSPALIDVFANAKLNEIPYTSPAVLPWTLVAVAPLVSGYQAFWSASTFLSPGTIRADANAPAGVAGRGIIGDANAVLSMALNISSATMYSGRHRVLAFLRTTPAATMLVTALNQQASAIGPQMTIPAGSGAASAAYWTLDLGVLIHDAFSPRVMTLVGQTPAGGATGNIDVGGIALLPEDTTGYHYDQPGVGAGSWPATYMLRGTDDASLRSSGNNNNLYNVTQGRRGRHPKFDPQLHTTVAVMVAPRAERYTTGVITSAEVRVRERFTFAR